MMRIVHHLPDLGHEHASLIARLALHSVFPAEDIEYFRTLLPRYAPARLLEALDQALDELAAEGSLPKYPFGTEADSYYLLYDGICHLAELDQEYPNLYLAAA